MKNRFVLSVVLILLSVMTCILLVYQLVIKEKLIDSIAQETNERLSFSAEVLAYNFSHDDLEQTRNWLTLKSELTDVDRVLLVTSDKVVVASNHIADEERPLLEVDANIFNFITAAESLNITGNKLRLVQPILQLGSNTPTHYLYLQRDITDKLQQLKAQVFYLSIMLIGLFSFFFFLYLRVKRQEVKHDITEIQKAITLFNDGAHSSRLTENKQSDFFPLQCTLNDSFALNEYLQSYLKAQAQFSDLVNGLVTDAIVETNAHGEITHVNKTAVSMFGYDSEDELIGSNVIVLIPTKYQRKHSQSMMNYSGKQHVEQVLNTIRNVAAVKKSGEAFPVEIVISQYKVQEKQRYIAFIRDFSEVARYENSIKKLAYFDALTGLQNLNGVIHQLKALKLPLQVSVIELEGLQDINDVYGPKVGDKYLCSFAQALSQLPLQGVIAARVRSSRFLVLHQSSLKDESKQFHKLNKKEIEIDDFTAKLKFVRCTAKLLSSESLGELLGQCDLALRDQENRGVGSVVKIDIDFLEELKYQAWLKQALEKAIESKQLYFDYQPKFDTKTLKPCAAEALIRWNCDGEMISPSVFITMAEKKGMMPLLDRYVIRTVCSQIRQWLDMNLEVLPISINLSARHLFEQDTIAVIFEHVGEFDIPPHMLEVEVTEYGLIKDYKKTAINMMRLEKAGISVAIDDYGTGHANLETVLSLPIKHLKIDQSFIRLGMKSVKGQAILENIISLAKSLKVVTTAEGVETQEQLDYLKNAQCDAIQGYLLSKPMKLKDFEDLMNRRNDQ
ncbi:MAG: hypothetical protein CMK64_11660 [Pseudoalteromonas sp.]|nr:hypothetical protein [Pseudoalteromonas sp.]|tara:strand:- start:1824 stop:4184 length:2361 start_codon:yes stop_codon:yes gene_type:complete